MSVKAAERVMASERIAPGMLPRVLNSFDMTIIFVAIVLFVVNASALQPAGQSAFTFWIVGFLVFLIPGALVTAQPGQMFVVMAAYLWATHGTMLSLNAAKNQAAPTDILGAVQAGFWGSHAFASVIGLILIWFFVSWSPCSTRLSGATIRRRPTGYSRPG
jgi:hypothetical protein